MKNFNENIKKLLIDLLVVVVVPGALFYWATTMDIGSGLLLDSQAASAGPTSEGQKFLSKLNELRTLNLDTSVFDSPVYRGLVDSSVPPPTDALGRPHPFIPPSTGPSGSAAAAGASRTSAGNTVGNLDTILRGR